MGMFGRSKPVQTYLPQDQPPSLAGNVMDFAARNLLGFSPIAMQRQKDLRNQQNTFLDDFAQRLAGTPDQVTQAQIGNSDGQDITAAFGPQYDLTPGRAPLNVNSAELPALALTAQRLGIPLSGIMDVLKAQQPDIKVGPDGTPYNAKSASGLPAHFGNPQAVNNTVVDLNDPENVNRVISSEPVKGAMPVYDNRGRVSDWYLPKGAAGAIAGGKAAEAAGSSPYDFISIPGPNGQPIVISKSRAAGGVFEGASPSDIAYGNETAKASAEAYKGIQTAGQQAAAKISRYKQIDTLLGNFEGGKLSPTGLEIASAANSLGFPMSKDLQNAQAADALGKALVLEMNGGSLGTGFSNADRVFIEKTVPSILQSAGGRRQIISIAVATEQRKQDVAQKARQWQQRFGRIDAADGTGKTFQDYLDAWSEAHPVFQPR